MRYGDPRIMMFVLVGILFVSISSVYAQTAEEYLKKGDASVQQDNYAKAISDYNKAIEINPNYAEAYYNRGLAYHDQCNFTQATIDYDKASKLNPKLQAPTYIKPWYATYASSNYSPVADDTRAIEIDPKNACAYFDRAYFDESADKAWADLNKAVALGYNFDYEDLRLFDIITDRSDVARGHDFFNKDNFSQAVAEVTKAIETNPDYAAAYYARGVNCYNHGNFSQAIADFTKFIKIGRDPDFAGVYEKRAAAYGNEGNWPQAISDFTKVIKINPNGYTYYNRGRAYMKQGHFAQALSDLDKAIEINNLSAAYEVRAQAYFGQKDFEKAWADVHEAERAEYSPDKEDLEFLENLKKASGRDK